MLRPGTMYRPQQGQDCLPETRRWQERTEIEKRGKRRKVLRERCFEPTISAGAGRRRGSDWLALDRVLLHSWCVILLITGTAKVVSALGASRILRIPDPIFGISFKHLFLAAGSVEVLVAAACYSLAANLRMKSGLIAWLATVFCLYRLGLWWLGWHGGCPCLGTLTDVLHIPAASADAMLKIALAYLVVTSYWMLWRCRQEVH